MEKTTTIPSLPCGFHSHHTIEKIDVRPIVDKRMYCMECILESADPKSLSQHLVSFSQLLSHLSVLYLSNSRKFVATGDKPPEFAEILSAQSDNLSKLKSHIKKQKESLEKIFKEITEVILEQINQTKSHYSQMLEEQLLIAQKHYDFFDKELKKAYPTNEDIQYLFPSKEELERRLSQFKTASELESFVNCIGNDLETYNHENLVPQDKKLEWLCSLVDLLEKSSAKRPVFETKALDFRKLASSIKQDLEGFLNENLTLLNPIYQDLTQGVPEKKIVFLGLDGAGKTTILYKLKLNEVISSVRTIGFNMEEISYKNIKFLIWDLGGLDKIRPLLKYHYLHKEAVVFVVDSSDRERIESAREELHKALAEEDLKDAKLLVFANKQDLPLSMSVSEVNEKLGLHTIVGRDWCIQGTCSLTGDGLYEGLDWLHKSLSKKKR